MWLSERAAAAKRERQEMASAGEVTIGGDSAGVYTTYEARDAVVSSPGGYTWRPRVGDGVLVMKGSAGESFIAGCVGETNSGLAEGEVRISSGGGAEILLKNNGDVILRGNIFLEGTVIINGASYVSGIGALGG